MATQAPKSRNGRSGMTIEQLETKVQRALLKRPQTLAEIAQRIPGDVSTKQLCRPIARLVERGTAVKGKGRPPQYTKA